MDACGALLAAGGKNGQAAVFGIHHVMVTPLALFEIQQAKVVLAAD